MIFLFLLLPDSVGHFKDPLPIIRAEQAQVVFSHFHSALRRLLRDHKAVVPIGKCHIVLREPVNILIGREHTV